MENRSTCDVIANSFLHRFVSAFPCLMTHSYFCNQSWIVFFLSNGIQLGSAEVCGTDGITYRNECELKQSACRKQQFIVVASQGDCGSLARLVDY